MRYFVGFIITIVLIVLLIMLLFRGDSGKQQVPTTSKPLISYVDTDATVRLTIDGPINAEQNHRQEQITVGRDNVKYEQLEGYVGTVRKQENFANTQENYDNFLHALSRAGFTLGNTDKTLQDEKGYCALGRRYIFELIENGRGLQRFWATSCGATHTYNGNTTLTLDLFMAQVPGVGDLESDFSLENNF